MVVFFSETKTLVSLLKREMCDQQIRHDDHLTSTSYCELTSVISVIKRLKLPAHFSSHILYTYYIFVATSKQAVQSNVSISIAHSQCVCAVGYYARGK